ncbi:MAG: hypothetical protein ACPG8W_17680 [Candidatus Promineifilaceae bacterium]
MTFLAQLHLITAGFMAGIGSAMFVFAVFVSKLHDSGRRGWFLRFLVMFCFSSALYLAIEGIRLGTL